MEDSSLFRKEFWNPNNATVIAERFGYVLNPAFIKAVTDRWEQTIRRATITQFLPIIGPKVLKEYKPPLTKLPHSAQHQL